MFRPEGRRASYTHRSVSRSIQLFAPDRHARSDGLAVCSFARMLAARVQPFRSSGRLRMLSSRSCSNVPAVGGQRIGHRSPLPPNYSSKPTPLRSFVQATPQLLPCRLTAPALRRGLTQVLGRGSKVRRHSSQRSCITWVGASLRVHFGRLLPRLRPRPAGSSVGCCASLSRFKRVRLRRRCTCSLRRFQVAASGFVAVVPVQAHRYPLPNNSSKPTPLRGAA
jgi:hypothetical protein